MNLLLYKYYMLTLKLPKLLCCCCLLRNIYQTHIVYIYLIKFWSLYTQILQLWKDCNYFFLFSNVTVDWPKAEPTNSFPTHELIFPPRLNEFSDLLVHPQSLVVLSQLAVGVAQVVEERLPATGEQFAVDAADPLKCLLEVLLGCHVTEQPGNGQHCRQYSNRVLKFFDKGSVELRERSSVP